MTDFELAQSLSELLPYVPERSKEFAQSLVSQFRVRGFLSRRQCYWASRLAKQAERIRNREQQGGGDND